MAWILSSTNAEETPDKLDFFLFLDMQKLLKQTMALLRNHIYLNNIVEKDKYI